MQHIGGQRNVQKNEHLAFHHLYNQKTPLVLLNSRAIANPSPLLSFEDVSYFPSMKWDVIPTDSLFPHGKYATERLLLYLSESSLMNSHQREGQCMHARGLKRTQSRSRRIQNALNVWKCSQLNISASRRPRGRERIRFNEHRNFTKMFSVSIPDNFANFIVNRHRAISSDSIALIW